MKTKNRPSSISYIEEVCYFLSDAAVCVAHATAKTQLTPILFAGGALPVTWSADPARQRAAAAAFSIRRRH